MLNLVKDEKKQEAYLIKTIPVISATNYAVDMIDNSLKDVVKLIATNRLGCAETEDNYVRENNSQKLI
jgi:hypothetical protein